MLNAKFRKLIKDPNLFFSDMVKNKKRKINSVQIKKEEGNYQYTVVSAVYNVGKYLDDFFKSMINQKLDFKKHIFLIMVDDGSHDNSAEIINRWKSKYPNNIKYIRQDNAGQSSARNAGLEYVTTEWVTFVDPDDFLNNDYFSSIDNNLFSNKNKKINLISCNIIMYLESREIYRDNHPLSYKFSKGNNLVDIKMADSEIQLSASSAFFRLSIIKEDGISFDGRVKPNFEDAHFISKYLLNIEDGFILFMKDAEYLYRKREDGTSTLDTSWTKPERFLNVPEFGYLDTLKMYLDSYGRVPNNIQKTILYEVLWYLKHLDNRPERTHFLDDIEKKLFINKMKEIFSYIDDDMIMTFNLAGIWFYHKLAMMSCFKNTLPKFQIAYVDRYDAAKELIRVRYFSNNDYFDQFVIDGLDTVPVYEKTTPHDFVGEQLVLERWTWISVHKAVKIEIKINNVDTSISCGGKQYKGTVLVANLIDSLKKQLPKFPGKRKYDNSWVLMDRDMQADDNAEHLYRFIRDNHPEQKIFFALRKESHDWARLKSNDFNLLDFDSSEHHLALGSCKKVISSHANYYVTNLLGSKMLLGRHFVFLQHGVTKDDISSWLNTKDSIDCFITASPYEYQSICSDSSKYNYSSKETFLTGFPRHDNLIRNVDAKEKLIIIMPTWRSSIVGPVLGDGDSRGMNPEFMSSTFAKHWKDLLHSEDFKALLERSGYKAAFFPHVNIRPYLDLFEIPEHIEIITHNDGSIQDLFIRSAMMITDYSSVAFEMAIQNKQTIYYQFDEEEFFSDHNYIKGYFDYRQNGFGPVVTTQVDLISALDSVLLNECLPDKNILARIDDMFPIRDDQNCARTYEAIISLDNFESSQCVELDKLKKYALQASSFSSWEVAELRWRKYINGFLNALPTEQRCEAIDFYFQALSEQGKYRDIEREIDRYLTDEETAILLLQKYAYLATEIGNWNSAEVLWGKYLDLTLEVHSDAVFNYLNAIRKQGRLEEVEQMVCGLSISNDSELQVCVKEIKALLFMSQHRWDDAILEWRSINKDNPENIKYCECLAYDFQYEELDNFILNDSELLPVISVYTLYARQNWDEVINKLKSEGFDLQSDFNLSARLLLMKSRAYQQLSDFDHAHKCLVRYESKVKNDPQCRYEIARLAYSKNQYPKVISQLSKACPDFKMLPKMFKIIYLKSLSSSRQFDKVFETLDLLPEGYSIDDEIIQLKANIYISVGRWDEALLSLGVLEQSKQEEIISEYLHDLSEKGSHEQVDNIITQYLSNNKMVSIDFLEIFATVATNAMVWASAECRWAKFIEVKGSNDCNALFNYFEALRNQNKHVAFEEKCREFSSIKDSLLQKTILRSKALSFMSRHLWSDAIKLWRALGEDNADNLRYCECLAYTFCYEELEYFSEMHVEYPLVVDAYALYARRNWHELVNLLSSGKYDLQNDVHISAHLLLMKSSAYRHLDKLDLAHKCLVRYESKLRADIQCRYEIAKVAFCGKQWKKVITQIDKASSDFSELPVKLKVIYLQSLYTLNFFSKMENLFSTLSSDELVNYKLLNLKVNVLISLNKWEEAYTILHSMESRTLEVVYWEALCLKNMGEYELAFTTLVDYKPIDTVSAWQLRAELAQLNDNWEDAYKCSLRAQWKVNGEVNITSSEIESLVMLRTH